jgi:hypothetical protein
MTAIARLDLKAPLGVDHTGQPVALAKYPDLSHARHAIEVLEAKGIDGDDLALVGDAAVCAAELTTTGSSDGRVLAFVSSWLAVGVMVGAVAGAVFGACFVGVVMAVWPGGLDSAGWILALITAWFAAGGAVLGGFVVIARKVGFSEAWPLTFETEVEGPTWLAIYGEQAPDPDVLLTTEPSDLRARA